MKEKRGEKQTMAAIGRVMTYPPLTQYRPINITLSEQSDNNIDKKTSTTKHLVYGASATNLIQTKENMIMFSTKKYCIVTEYGTNRLNKLTKITEA